MSFHFKYCNLVRTVFNCSRVMSFSSIARDNPFEDEQSEPVPSIPPPLSIRNNKDPSKLVDNRSMPQSRSESTLKPLSRSTRVQAAPLNAPFTSPTVSPTEDPEKADYRAIGIARGRPIGRCGSPVKALQNVDENEKGQVQGLSRKRSRSPVKRFFGLGKSTSLRDIAGEPQVQARDDPKDESKKVGLRLWGDRLKHGFLVN